MPSAGTRHVGHYAGGRSIEVLDQNDLIALLVIDDFVDKLLRDEHPEAAHAHSCSLADFEVIGGRPGRPSECYSGL